MRVYVPATAADLRRLLAERALQATAGYAVTASLRAWFGAGDDEEREHAASVRAAEQLDGTGLRFVLPVDVPDPQVSDAGGADDPGAVRLAGPLPIGWVAAVLVVQEDDLLWYGVQEADTLLG